MVSIILLCVYGCNKKAQNKTFFSSLSKLLEEWKVTYTTDKVIVGGDYNLVPDLWMDRLPPKGHCHNYEEIMVDFISKGNLIDIWRMRKTNTMQYTWYNSANNRQCSRLDYWLISTDIINEVHKCEISASPLTDHCAITMSLHLGGFEPIPNPLWKFNSSLLEIEEFCRETKNLVKEINELEMSPLTKWEWFKFKIREIAISTSKYNSRVEKQKQQDIINDINKLCHKTDLSLDEQVKLNDLQSQLKNLYLEKAKGAFVRLRAHWIEGGEKNSSNFFSLEKQRQTKKKIYKLLVNNICIDNQDQVNEEIRTFYSNLIC